MHHIYHTEGIILESRNFGEAGKFYFIFTRDLGLVMASAQGVRKVSSKLRFVLQNFAYVKIDFVAARDIFRITSASKTNLLEDITKKKENIKIFANISRLLKRLLAGVEPNIELFDDVMNGLIVLEKTESKEDLVNIEMILVLRILSNLGYIGDEDELQNFIRSPFESGLLIELSQSKKKVLSHINKALKETHL